MPSLRAAARTGIRWTSLAALVTGLAQLAQTLVLVRLLDADEFGAMAASMVVVGFAQRFSDMGISYAVVVRQVDRDALSSLFWANMAFAALLAAAVAAAAPLVAGFYGDDDVTAVVLVLSLVLPASALGSVAYGLAQKDLHFDRIARYDILGALAGAAVAIGSAAAGAGAVSLALGLVTAALVRSVLFLAGGAADWAPRLRLRWSEVRPHAGFGGYQMGERAATFLSGNLDYLLIGRFLGTQELGYYSIAYQLIIRPLAQLNPVIMRVATPIFARRQADDAALRRGFAEVSRLIALVSFPALAGLAVVAPAFVPVVLGDEWLPSVALIQILAFVGILKAVSNPVGPILLAKDRADLGFKLNLLILAVTAAALYAVVREGAEAVAWAYLGTTFAGFALVQTWVLDRLIALRPRDYLGAFAAPAGVTAVMAAAAAIAYEAVQAAGGAGAAVLMTAVAAGAIAYPVLLAGLMPAEWRELRAFAARGGRSA